MRIYINAGQVIYAYKYVGTNNEHAAVSQGTESSSEERAREELNQRNVLSEPLTAPTLVRGNRRADTRAHTPAPYFNHKLMFCLPRMHNCASRAHRPFPDFSCTSRERIRPDATHRPEHWPLISLAITGNEVSNGFANTRHFYARYEGVSFVKFYNWWWKICSSMFGICNKSLCLMFGS